ncbi:MAG: hypothetical protein JSW61_10935 [Candidatus Thorarchaeota archaeon]|nr:MAG: hypothetical protein JSW61_10935 [Candidatus Thorarchaeota archaeon]
MALEDTHEEPATTDKVLDLRTRRTDRELLPILIVFFTPNAIAFQDYGLGDVFSFFFFLGRLDLWPQVMQLSFEFILPYPGELLLISGPALIAGIAATWQLRRLSRERSTRKGVLLAMVIVTVIWTAAHLGLFLGAPTAAQTFIPVLPLPFGPLTAVLLRDNILSLTEQIDSLENAEESPII